MRIVELDVVRQLLDAGGLVRAGGRMNRRRCLTIGAFVGLVFGCFWMEAEKREEHHHRDGDEEKAFCFGVVGRGDFLFYFTNFHYATY